ncbi:hypothetical protein D1871_19890 [Nakamurella silvestris]|nr:hypothetical protein D1871_19890 [Nakamurella silvestris]
MNWTAAAIEAVLITVLLLLWLDTLRDRPGWTTAQANRRALPFAVAIPIGFVLVLLLPLWLGLILLAVPALAILAMAMAS